MIDLHCHYLPFVDDGARSVAEALLLARAAVSNGISEAVLTPHIHPGRWDNRLSTLKRRFEAFESALRIRAIPLRLHLGAEIRLGADTLALLAEGELPVIGQWQDQSVVMLEFPPGQLPIGAINIVEPMQKRGVLPMLAHPERNRHVMLDRQKIEPFVRAGCLLQITAGSVCGRFGPMARDSAFELIDAGWVSFMATDAHNLVHRPPILAEARRIIAQRYGAEAAAMLTRTNPKRLLRRAPGIPHAAQHLSREEVKRLLDAAENARHRTLLVMIYGAGLRVAEAVSLRVCDIRVDSMTVHIEPTEVTPERVCPLSRTMIDALRADTNRDFSNRWLFPSTLRPDAPMRESSAKKIFLGTLRRAGMNEAYRLRDLRRAFAVHQVEDGVDLPTLQCRLGHRHLATTLAYVAPNRDPAPAFSHPS